jgi:hypothetical protein
MSNRSLDAGKEVSLDQLAPLTQDRDLTFLLVNVDANMVHGWPLLSAALTASVPSPSRRCP